MFKRILATKLSQGVCAFSTARTASSALRAGVLLQRDPIVIQQAKGFEASADAYFQWLEYQSAEVFPRDFFLKKGSTAETKWMDIEDERAKEWFFDKESKPKFKSVKREIVEDDTAEPAVIKRVEVNPRETEADAKNDVQSLERKLDRTLYLLIKDKSNAWVLPHGDIGDEELLHEAARRNLKQACGGKMNVWFVGCGPIGHIESGSDTTFFIKGHILAGQVKPASPLASEFKWVTKEEIEATVDPKYWASIKDMIGSV